MEDLMADKPTIQMKMRTNWFLLAAILVFAAAIIVKLFKLSVLDNKFYQDKANADHFGAISISANRGAIYDTNGVILAQSATVYKVFMDPDLFRSEIAKKDEAVKAQQKQIAKGELPAGTVIRTAEEVQNDVIEYLAEQL